MTLPQDFPDELESELRCAQAAFAHSHLLVVTRGTLHTRPHCRTAAPPPDQVFDLVEAAGDAAERERRTVPEANIGRSNQRAADN
jgi:hypothetical protein